MGHFLAFLLATAIVASVTLWVLGSTLANPEYMHTKAEATGLYSKLTVVLPGLSEPTLQAMSEALLPQYLDYLLNDGPPPVVDFGAGPVSLGQEGTVLPTAGRALVPAARYAPFVAVGLFIVMMIVLAGHRLAAVRSASISAAIGLSITAGLIWLLPAMGLQTLRQEEFRPLRDALDPFVAAVSRDIALWMGAVAAALIALAVTVSFVKFAGHFKSRLPHGEKSETPTQFPTA